MSRFFYVKLALENLKKNKTLYLPYVITAIGMSAMYYIMQAITWDKGIAKMYGAEELRMILILGCGVIAVFACIFLFYTNSFLMKRRKKEFGLFNILGMEKRHIGRMMLWESVIVGGISIVGGLAAGIILNKLIVLLLLRITHLEVPFGFSIYGKGLVDTAILFLAIYALTLLYNLQQVQKAKPVELLQSTSQGEAEPKTRWIMTVVGVVALAGAYYIAITTTNPLGALLLFFVAVILVIIGTYCLFTAGSIAVLKLLRKNKRYYYQTAHFTSVSGMIYRMKQNAVGLANICILSTAVLVMISGTVSLYAGMNSLVEKMYPSQVQVEGQNLKKESQEALVEMVESTANECDVEIEKLFAHQEFAIAAVKNGGEYTLGFDNPGVTSYCTFITMEDYEALGGKAEEVAEDEVLVYVYQGEREDTDYNIAGNMFHIKKYLEDYPKGLLGTGAIVVADSYYIVVKDEAVLEQLYQTQLQIYEESASKMEYIAQVELTGGTDKEQEYTTLLGEKITNYDETALRDGTSAWINEPESREAGRARYNVFYGGFLFLGIFLGFVFLLATVLIIYYKQISEGYEDKERYEIMRKVGMSHKEVKASIRSQILKVFFLPLVTACIHLAAAFPLMRRLLMMFGMNDCALFAICALITVAVFAIVYGIVYMMTARTYYRIVE